MILFFIVEISIILAGVVVALGHTGLANRFFNILFFLLILAVIEYIILIINNKTKL